MRSCRGAVRLMVISRGVPPEQRIFDEPIGRLQAMMQGRPVDRMCVDLGTFGAGSLQSGSTAGAQLVRLGHPRCAPDAGRRRLCLHPAAARHLQSDFVRGGWHLPGGGARLARALPAPSAGVGWLLGARPQMPMSPAQVLELSLPQQAPWSLQPEAHVEAPDGGQAVALEPVIEGPLALLAALLGPAGLRAAFTGDARRYEALLDWAFGIYEEASLRAAAAAAPWPVSILWMDDDFSLVPADLVDRSILPRWVALVRRMRARWLVAMLCDEIVWLRLPALARAGLCIVQPKRLPAGGPARWRDGLPPRLILHGVTDFVLLLEALRAGRARTLLGMAAQIAASWPVIAAPNCPLPWRASLSELAWCVSFLKTLDVGSQAARQEILREHRFE